MELSIQNKQNTFNIIRTEVCDRLAGLTAALTYHNLDHTLDVVRQCERLALEEGIRDECKIYLLKVAALYHDTGFLNTYAQHEEASCEIFLQDAKSTISAKKTVLLLCGSLWLPNCRKLRTIFLNALSAMLTWITWVVRTFLRLAMAYEKSLSILALSRPMKSGKSCR
jgi:hypothetical protein